MSAETPGKEPMDRLIEFAARARAQNGSPKEPDATEQQALGLLAAYFEEASGKTSIWVQIRLTDLDSGRALLAAEPAVQVAAVRLAFTGLQQQDGSLLRQLLAGLHRPLGLGEIDSYFAYVGLRTLLGGLARRQLPYRDEDMVQILTVVSRRGGWEWLPLEACFRSMQRRIAECGLSPEVREALVAVQRAGDKQVTDAATRKALAIVNELLREGEREPVEIEPDDDWGRVARPALAEVPTTERFSWVALLVHAQTATASKPSAAWQKTARERIAAMGEEAFCARVIAWLDLLQAPPSN